MFNSYQKIYLYKLKFALHHPIYYLQKPDLILIPTLAVYNIYLCMYLFMCAQVHLVCVEIRGELVGVASPLLHLHGLWELNSDHEDCVASSFTC